MSILGPTSGLGGGLFSGYVVGWIENPEVRTQAIRQELSSAFSTRSPIVDPNASSVSAKTSPNVTSTSSTSAILSGISGLDPASGAVNSPSTSIRRVNSINNQTESAQRISDLSSRQRRPEGQLTPSQLEAVDLQVNDRIEQIYQNRIIEIVQSVNQKNEDLRAASYANALTVRAAARAVGYNYKSVDSAYVYESLAPANTLNAELIQLRQLANDELKVLENERRLLGEQMELIQTNRNRGRISDQELKALTDQISQKYKVLDLKRKAIIDKAESWIDQQISTQESADRRTTFDILEKTQNYGSAVERLKSLQGYYENELRYAESRYTQGRLSKQNYETLKSSINQNLEVLAYEKNLIETKYGRWLEQQPGTQRGLNYASTSTGEINTGNYYMAEKLTIRQIQQQQLEMQRFIAIELERQAWEVSNNGGNAKQAEDIFNRRDEILRDLNNDQIGALVKQIATNVALRSDTYYQELANELEKIKTQWLQQEIQRGNEQTARLSGSSRSLRGAVKKNTTRLTASLAADDSSKVLVNYAKNGGTENVNNDFQGWFGIAFRVKSSVAIGYLGCYLGEGGPELERPMNVALVRITDAGTVLLAWTTLPNQRSYKYGSFIYGWIPDVNVYPGNDYAVVVYYYSEQNDPRQKDRYLYNVSGGASYVANGDIEFMDIEATEVSETDPGWGLINLDVPSYGGNDNKLQAVNASFATSGFFSAQFMDTWKENQPIIPNA